MKLLVILGPTASGKTSLSIKLAKRFKGEIISADSRQVYKGMDIGTGKITKKEMQGIPHYLLDVASPKKRFDVAQFKSLAEKAIAKIVKRKRLPVIVGGTGFYIQTLIDNITIPEVKPDWKLRRKLEKKTQKALYSLLKARDPRRARTIDKNNPRRLIRALEIVLKTGKPIPPPSSESRYEAVILGVKKDQRQLKQLVEKRLTKRLKQGMIAEVKKLNESGVSFKRLEELGLEYKYIALYLQGIINKEEMIDKLQKKIEQYAKRQMTWFKRDKRIKWIKNEKQAIDICQKEL